MNKKSFFCGVVVGVLITWALSFYLYYSLNNSQPLSNLQKNIFNYDSEEDDSEEEKVIDNSIKQEKLSDGKSAYIKDKFRKEKENRKISRKLVDELTPVTAKQETEFGLIRNAEDQFVRDSGYKTHAFNVLVSNQIGPFRDIPDTRHKV